MKKAQVAARVKSPNVEKKSNTPVEASLKRPSPHARLPRHHWQSKAKWWLKGRWGRLFKEHPTTRKEGEAIGSRMFFRGPLSGSPPDHLFFCGAPGCAEFVHLIWHPRIIDDVGSYDPDAWRDGTFLSIANQLCPKHEGDPQLQQLMRRRTAAYDRRAAAKLKARRLAERLKTPAQKARERRALLKLPVDQRPLGKRAIARYLKTGEMPGDSKREATAVSPGILLVSAGRGRRGKSVFSEVLAGAEVRS